MICGVSPMKTKKPWKPIFWNAMMACGVFTVLNAVLGEIFAGRYQPGIEFIIRCFTIFIFGGWDSKLVRSLRKIAAFQL